MAQMDLPPNVRDTFYQDVWKLTRMIPHGKVSTYGQIAGYIPCPQGVDPGIFAAFRARWVGYAMSACPPDVPWQRVVNAQGKISIRGGAETQRNLLISEGVAFDSGDRIDLKRFGWAGPPAEWLKSNHFTGHNEPHQPNLF